jgi:hypothetical protein
MKSSIIMLLTIAAFLLVASPVYARRARCRGGRGGIDSGVYVSAAYPAYGYDDLNPLDRTTYRRPPPYGYVVPQPPFYFGHPVYGYAYRGPWWW